MDSVLDITQDDLLELKKLFAETTGKSDDFGETTKVRIADDKMKVWIYLVPPEPGKEYQVADLVDMLNSNGVTTGHIYSRLKAMVKKGVYNREVVVARGQMVEEGVHGYYEYFFDTEGSNGKPKIREDGSVDYTAINNVTNIKKGDKIALYHPAVPGKDGILVDGTVTKAGLVKEMPPLRGVAIKREDNTYYANETGKIELNESTIDIRNIHEISGDVDYNTGRVEFWGDITINGNVGAGAYIRSGRNLIINGVVEAATLFAGGDIILKRGVQGNMQAKVKARGNIMANFLEQCQVECDGNIDANYILNATVTSGQKIKVQGKKGSIIGGVCSGLTGVETEHIGNESEVKTIVHAGYMKDTYDKWIMLRAQEQEVEAQLQEALEQMEDLLKRRRFQGAASTKNLLALNTKQKELFAQLDEVKVDVKNCKDKLDKGRGVKIVTRGTVYRGTVLEIENLARPIYQEISMMQYKCQDGVIVAVPAI